MAKSYFHLSLCLAGTIACLSADIAQANLNAGVKKNSNQLYHERKESSQIEKFFKQLPSIENEVESLFEEVSFYSAFEPSPLVDQNKYNNEVEDVFRRALQFKPVQSTTQQEGQSTQNAGSSFLSDHLQSAGVFGGSGARKGGIRGSGGDSTEPLLPLSERLNVGETGAIPQTGNVGKIAKSSSSFKVVAKSVSKGIKSTKSTRPDKDINSGLKHQKFKKDKRYKGEKRSIDHKLTKSGKQDDKFSYDPYDADDDTYALHDDWSFDSWSWELVEEDNNAEQSRAYNEANKQVTVDDSSIWQDNTFGGMKGWRAGPINTASTSENMMGRMNPVMGKLDSGEVTSGGELQKSQMDEYKQPYVFTNTQPNPKTGNYQFNFPTIQHMLFSGPIHLKAHSPIDLSIMDPEIFAVLQSILTPYLQETMGPTLHGYTLEVDYSRAHDKSVGENDIETLMEVKCAFKVVSNSVYSFKLINHSQASRWINDFFAGPEIYKLMEALRSDNIPVNDITFVDQDFQISATVAEANNQMVSAGSPVFKNPEKSSPGAMVWITLSVFVIGMLLFLQYTGRLPSNAQIGEFSLTARDSIARHSATARDSITRNTATARDSIAKHGKMARNSIAKHMPSPVKKGESKPLKKILGIDSDDDEIRERRRTYSGTFRRHPTGGLQKAALQKTPALSVHYLAESASTSSSSAASSDGDVPRLCKKSTSFTDMLDQDEYSYSNFSGDYDLSYAPSTPSRRTSTGDEFSVTDTLGYDSSIHGRETLLGRVSKTVSQAAYLMTPGNSSQKQEEPLKSPIPSSAPRRVTAADIASPRDLDNWSVRSYETRSPSRKSPSDHPLYREWNESETPTQRSPSDHPLYRGWSDSGPELRIQSSDGNDTKESSDRQTLSMPRFT